jgi:hypothetical protein
MTLLFITQKESVEVRGTRGIEWKRAPYVFWFKSENDTKLSIREVPVIALEGFKAFFLNPVTDQNIPQIFQVNEKEILDKATVYHLKERDKFVTDYNTVYGETTHDNYTSASSQWVDVYENNFGFTKMVPTSATPPKELIFKIFEKIQYKVIEFELKRLWAEFVASHEIYRARTVYVKEVFLQFPGMEEIVNSFPSEEVLIFPSTAPEAVVVPDVLPSIPTEVVPDVFSEELQKLASAFGAKHKKRNKK